MMKALRLRARAFSKDTSGSMSVETVLIFPLLLWFYLSTFTYFDAYRTQATNMKAAVAIADAISRENFGVDATYLNTMQNMLQYLNNTSHNTRMRVTVMTRNNNNGRLISQWSCVYGSGGGNFRSYNNSRLRKLDSQIPPSPSPDELIMVETYVDYVPPFSARLFDDEVPDDGMIKSGNPEGLFIGLQPTTFSNREIVRGRGQVNQFKLLNGLC